MYSSVGESIHMAKETATQISTQTRNDAKAIRRLPGTSIPKIAADRFIRKQTIASSRKINSIAIAGLSR